MCLDVISMHWSLCSKKLFNVTIQIGISYWNYSLREITQLHSKTFSMKPVIISFPNNSIHHIFKGHWNSMTFTPTLKFKNCIHRSQCSQKLFLQNSISMDLRTSFSFYVSYCCSWFIEIFILNEIKSLLFQWNFSFPKYFLSFCGFEFHSNLYFYTNFAHFYVFLLLSTVVCNWHYYIQTQCSELNLCNCRFSIIYPLWFKYFNDKFI